MWIFVDLVFLSMQTLSNCCCTWFLHVYASVNALDELHLAVLMKKSFHYYLLLCLVGNSSAQLYVIQYSHLNSVYLGYVLI